MTTQDNTDNLRNAPPIPADGKCPHCEGNSFTLARDKTQYTTGLRFFNGEVTQDGYTDTQDCSEEDSVRLLCDSCYMHFAVPEDLQ